MEKLIERKHYIEKLKKWKDKTDLIKIVTGIRRCGKSTLFLLFQNYLKTVGVQDSQIQNINLEDMSNAPLLDYKTLHDYVLKNLSEDKMNYVFIDEIQLAADFPKAINSLRLRENIDLYVTGSNAYMFSSKIVTLLSGRYIEIKMQPLSFSEYLSAAPNENYDKAYQNYLLNSSFPQTLSFQNDKQLIRDYLTGLYSAIIQKDIMLRKSILDFSRLDAVAKFVFSIVGSETSLRNICNVMSSGGRKIYPQTVESYLDGLCDGYLLYKAGRYDIKGKEILRTNAKYYIADVGLRFALLGVSGDKGHLLENIVYLELLRRGYDVYIGKIDIYDANEKKMKTVEVDFVARKPGGIIEYYQVTETMLGEETSKRELAPLRAINDNYKKTVITADLPFSNTDNGIEIKNIIEWLLE
ncbi:MAG: ATP-binding protein [Endomicrobium sp.]|jgi:predicted AAA+ superfamily ATPase|nr:ATP-binding protein [Endomicrobium sp.]